MHRRSRNREDAVIIASRNEDRPSNCGPFHPQEGAPYLDDDLAYTGGPRNPLWRPFKHR